MKALRSLVVFLLLTLPGAAQEMAVQAEFLKEEMNPTFEAIKEFSQSKWKNDHAMILHEINSQAEAFHGIMEIAGQNRKDFDEIFIAALIKWTEDKERLRGEMEMRFQNPTTDWKMVFHEMQKQIKAKDAYQN